MLKIAMAVIGPLYRTLKALNALANRHAGALLAVGLAAVALHNWRQWQRDKSFLAQREEPEPLPPLASWPDLPKVSVLVAAWNEADNIERHIQSFLALRYPNKQLVLCAGGPDGTYEIAARHANDQVVVLRQQSGEGKQWALARGFSQTQGEVIFLTDADCLLADEPFERTVRPVAEGKSNVATGTSRPLSEQLKTPLVQSQWAPSYYVETHDAGVVSLGILGRNACLRREMLAEAWEADQEVRTGTDYYLALRIRAQGHSIQRVPHSVIETEFPNTVQQYVRQQSRWLKNLLLWGFRFQDWYHARVAVVSMVFGLIMLGLPILLPVLGIPILILFMVLWTHVLLARIRYVRFLELRNGLSASPMLIPYALVVPLADFLAYARAAVDVLFAEGRDKW